MILVTVLCVVAIVAVILLPADEPPIDEDHARDLLYPHKEAPAQLATARGQDHQGVVDDRSQY